MCADELKFEPLCGVSAVTSDTLFISSSISSCVPHTNYSQYAREPLLQISWCSHNTVYAGFADIITMLANALTVVLLGVASLSGAATKRDLAQLQSRACERFPHPNCPAMCFTDGSQECVSKRLVRPLPPQAIACVCPPYACLKNRSCR